MLIKKYLTNFPIIAIITIMLFLSVNSVFAQNTNNVSSVARVCNGVKLNTNVPFIGDCIEFGEGDGSTNVTKDTAFPILMGAMAQILVTVILVFSFVMIIVAGVMMSSSGGEATRFNDGKKLIMKVIAGLALLWASWVILKLINPSFFW